MRPLPRGIFHNAFQLPALEVANPTGLLDLAVSEVRMSSLHKSHSRLNTSSSSSSAGFVQPDWHCISAEALERANETFKSIATDETQSISIYRMDEVLQQLGLNLTSADIIEIINQLEVKDTFDISFSETVEIATFIHEQKMSLFRGMADNESHFVQNDTAAAAVVGDNIPSF